MFRKIPTARALTRVILTLVCALVLFLRNGYGQRYEFNSACDNAWRSVLMFRFGDAQSELDRLKIADPSNLLPYYIENYIDFLVLFAGEDRNYFEQAKERKDTRLKKLEQGDPSSPYYRFCLAEVNMQWAFARLKFREYAAAGLELRRAGELLRENRELHPGFLPDQVGLGVLHALAGVIPENYKWIAGLIGFDGELEEGISELGSVAAYNGRDPFVRSLKVPANLFIALIEASFRSDKRQAVQAILRFNTDPDLLLFSGSPIVSYARSSVYLKTGNNAKVLEILSQRQEPEGAYRLHFLDYLYGTALLNDLDPGAPAAFRTFIAGFTGGNYIKSSWQKIAWSFLISGDTAGYRKNISLALTQGNKDVDEDKQAWYEASSEIIPNVTLLRARLLYDGGYYDRALTELLSRSLRLYVKDRRDLAEYYYRLGRIYHALGQEGKALQNYTASVQQGKDLPQYFAAGASLQMGMIHEKNREFRQADSCYRLCLSLDYKEYRNSLGQKARAGLSRVKKEIP